MTTILCRFNELPCSEWTDHLKEVKGQFDVAEMYQYHWHFEIMPKLSKAAGFKWDSGFYFNPSPGRCRD
jgi:hypothetical protein